MDNAIMTPTTIKRLGRRPLSQDKRRIQFGTRIAPQTLQGLKQLGETKGEHLGRVIDDLVLEKMSSN